MESHSSRSGGSGRVLVNLPIRPPDRTINRDPITNNFKLHVSNIPKTWTKITLTNVFEKVGTPQNVYLNKTGHTPTNWGFVEFKHYREAAKAIDELGHNDVLNIVVVFARDKSNENFHGSDFGGSLGSLSEDVILKSPTPKKDSNLKKTFKNDKCLSFSQPNENYDYICKVFDSETVGYAEEALFQRVVKYYKENPSVSNCCICGAKSTLACSVCGADYCSETCQENDWPKHYERCTVLSDKNNDQPKELVLNNPRPLVCPKDTGSGDTKMEYNSKDKGYKPFPKKQFEDRNLNSRKFENFKFGNSENRKGDDFKKQNERFVNQNNTNIYSKPTVEVNHSRLVSEKQNTGNGRCNIGEDNFSNSMKNQSDYNSESSRGSSIQAVKPSQSDVKEMKIPEPISKPVTSDVKDIETSEPIAEPSKSEVKDKGIHESVEENRKHLIPQKTFERLANPDPLSSGDLVNLCRVIDSSTVLVIPNNDTSVDQQIQIECLKSEEKFDTPPSVGDYAAFYMENIKCYFRCRIDNTTENDKYEVYNIDWGTNYTAKLEHLHPLPLALCKIPCRITAVKLKGLKKVEQTDKFKTYLKNIMDDEKVLKIEFEPESNLATLTINEDGEVVNEKLQELLEFKILPDLNGKYTMKCLPELKLPKGESITFLVTQTDPLYLQRLSDLTPCSELNEKIISFCESDKTSLYNPCVDELCLAKFEGEWYRSLCMEETNKGISALMLIDFGNFFRAPTSDIRKIPPELLTLPALSIACQIKGLPVDKSPEQERKLNAFLAVYEQFEAVVEDQTDDYYYISVPSLLSALKN